jgi:AbrB family looped-hinge helix DNA binding protein
MSHSKPNITVAKDGRITLPREILDKHGWPAGTKLLVVETPEGVLLKRASVFPLARHEDVYGSLKYHGKPKTIGEMDEAIAIEVKRRHARGRY